MPADSLIASWLLAYKYAIVYPLTVGFGPPVVLIAGFLLKLGTFTFWPLYFLILAGDLTGDVVWYWVGHRGARKLIAKYGHWMSITQEKVAHAERFFHRHQIKILFISKITTGFGFAIATLIAAGAARVPFYKYMTINTLGGFVWIGFLMGVGYFFGHLYTLIDTSLQWGFLVGVTLTLLLVAYGITKAIRQRFKDI
ncbi:MAG: VTT domain-containing protein [Patescibacteria group bacterium]|nr:VTT domain-containing protein [Patescibacteria group bacterium]